MHPERMVFRVTWADIPTGKQADVWVRWFCQQLYDIHPLMMINLYTKYPYSKDITLFEVIKM